jgi:hypothetical protein
MSSAFVPFPGKRVNRFSAVGTALAAMFALAPAARGGGAAGPPLILERTIALPGVVGRIDHLAEDAQAHRLFVAELGADTVEAVDLAQSRGVGRIAGQHEPQGVAWLADRHELVVASGDGRVGFYSGDALKLTGELKLGDDADNVRVDKQERPVVGYGAGALALIDPARRAVVSSVRLPAHPESFQLDGGRAIVNVPNAGRIVVVDVAARTTLAQWRTAGAAFNFPMALNKRRHVVAVVFRLPARLRLIETAAGRTLFDAPTCGDADDVFFDPTRGRIYVICGAGVVDVFQQAADPADYKRLARIATRPGARTGLFSSTDDRLYVAARATGGRPAAILVYRPAS